MSETARAMVARNFARGGRTPWVSSARRTGGDAPVMNSRMPWRCASTASSFQKPVAASTLPAASEATELKPIVTSSTPLGSPPSAATADSTTAVSGVI